MKLGTNKDVLPEFIEQQIQQSMPAPGKQHSSASTSSSVANTEKYFTRFIKTIVLMSKT